MPIGGASRPSREAHYNWRGGRIKTPAGYIKRLQPSHPRADGKGYVWEHLLVVEAALGKAAPRKAVIHHLDRDPANNSPHNLVLCQDQAYHRLLHRRQDALDTCNNAAWRKCVYCGAYGDPTEMYVSPSAEQALHRQCERTYKFLRRNA